MKMKVMRLPHAEGLPLPAYQTDAAAGFDLVAAIAAETSVTILPGARALIPTGYIFEIPKKMEAQVRPRSGLAIKHGVTVLNSPGTIDADYRGEVSVILINHGNEPFVIARGERIAQMIVAPVTRVKLRETKKIAPTKRGKGGFGSTGIGETPSQASTEAGKSVASVSRKTKTKSPAKKR
ncbi:dUTP diphosphatase [Hyphomicrobium sp.]|uniref:dUTP diphosphatase n=1 Tax=Hyphomicrobium sp. TaxID=82 RepID=UPI000FB9AB56|nr:dUTP diphosphatase [Hyphomicrobium sp.]RUP00107.1 MAG: dUTP diphosphatase [Hyphomicrobium sp.]